MKASDRAARWRREMAKGWTRLALLTLLARGESYGYAVVAALDERGLPGASDATIYPLLRDLEREGALDSEWRSVGEGVPARKYYTLTPEGDALRRDLLAAWTELRQALDTWLEESE